MVAVRNEEENILALLQDFENQNYDKDNLEVLIVDDHSEDKTRQVITDFKKRSTLNISLLELEKIDLSPKKAAIALGVQQALGDVILTTDGDCRVGSEWIATQIGYFNQKEAKFLMGPVTFTGDHSFFGKLQAIEFSSLMGAGAASLYYRKPVMCNGANLGFLKKAFLEVGGFAGNEKIASGDDVFLMRKIHQKYPESVFFAKDQRAIVHTYPLKNLKEFINQRIRWAGKWNHVGGTESKWLPVFIFSYHLFTLILYIKLILNQIFVTPFLSLIFLKYLAEYIFLSDVLKFLGKRRNFFLMLIASVFYPIYAVFVGMVANFTGYTWKGRKY